jgi:uncharacterized protein (DUF1778 family)
MPSNEASAKDARLNMRLTTEALDTIKDAASIQQQDVTSFVLGAALDRARSVLAEERVLRLSPHDLTHLEAMLDREPEVIPQLAALLTRFGNPAQPSADRGDRTRA